MVTNEEKWFVIFLKATFDTGLKGGSIYMLQTYNTILDRRWPVQYIYKFGNLVLLWLKMAETSKFAHFQIFSTLFVLKIGLWH